MSRIIQNAIKILTHPPKYIISKNTHDFVTYYFNKDKTEWIAVDGGLSYIRRAGDLNMEGKKWIDFSLYSNDDFELIYARLLWKTCGINGKEKPRCIPLCECSTKHLKNILQTQPQINGTIYEKVIKYLLYGHNPIYR